MATSLPDLDGPRLAPAGGAPVRALVVLLHGFGSNGRDMIGLAPAWRQALPDAMFVAPDAPQLCPGAPGGCQWWPLVQLTPAALAAGAASAAAALDAFLDAELARHRLAPDRLVLAGFSQGTMMALHVGLRRAQPIAGIVGYSGALADVGALDTELRSRPPVLLVHGSADDIVPAGALRIAAARLGVLGIDAETLLVPGLAHGVDPSGMAAGAAFARRVLAKA